MWARPLFLAAGLLLGGCMARIPVSQLDAFARPTAGPTAAPRLWYVGLGLYDETWSQGDVAETAAALDRQAVGFRVTPVLLSNGSRDRLPAPDRANVTAAVAEIARRAQPDDVGLIYASTHGAPGALARQTAGRQLEPVTPAEIESWLAPLGERNTVVILSACFSGSFIPALRAPHRIVIAAARRDRTSFGCRAGAEHTVFGQAFLTALATPGQSLHAVVDRTKDEIAEAERRMGIRLPSEPQVSVGGAVVALYETPAF